jgi:hypothetical protein
MKRITVINFVFIVLLISLFVMHLEGQAKEKQPKTSVCKTKCCIDNFSHTGSIMVGDTFKTFMSSKTIKPTVAFKRAARAMAGLGWQITSANKDVGIISGATTIHQITSGKAVQATLSISIDEGDRGGIYVEATMFAPAGTKLLEKEVQKDFCKIFEAIEK